jgi:stress response protein YsnF
MVSQSYENKFGIKLSDDQRISNLDSNGLIKTEELVQKIPLYNEKLDVTKKNENGNLKIEKKWITVKKEIEIPLKYEEIYINDKVFNSYSDKEKGEIFFQIKSKIADAFSREKSDEKDNKQPEPFGSEVEIVDWEPEESEPNKVVVSETAIPISFVTIPDQTGIQQAPDQTGIQQAPDQTGIQQAPDQTGIQQAPDQTGIQQAPDQTNTQETIELWGEEIIIDKRMVKLAEIVIKKYQVNEKRNIDVDVYREKLTLKFPGNFKEEIF